MHTKLKNNLALPEWSVPIILLVMCILTYGILLPDMGFYWDDWPSAWFNHIAGPSIFPEAFVSDRPLLGRLFMLTMSIMGSSILRWQVFALAVRWLSSLAFWTLLRITWPSKTREAFWAASFFAIYPAFTQQWIAITYSHVFIVYSVFIASLILTVYALRKATWFRPATIGALLLSGLSVFTAEYFIGLEIIRLMLIWLVVGRGQISNKQAVKSKLKQMVKIWLPYAILLILFIVWRIFIQGFPRGQIQTPNATNVPPLNVLEMISSILAVIVQDCLEVLVGAWGVVWNPASWLAYTAPVIADGIWIVAIIIAILYALVSIKIYNHDQQESGSSGKLFAIIGLISLVAGGLPFWAINLPYKTDFPNDRTAIPMILGASLLIVGLFDLATQNIKPKAILAAILIAGAFCYHYDSAASYVKEYEDQKTFFWQLYWRVPNIEPGTTLITDAWPFKYNTDNSLTAPLNWIYHPDEVNPDLDFVIINLSARLGNSLPGTRDEETGRVTIERNQPIQVDYRARRFDGNTNRMLAFIYRPPACLRILDPRKDMNIYSFPQTMYDIIPLSDPELITPKRMPSRPPYALFGKEQKKEWCLFFEEADLARQQGKWDEITKIGTTAFEEHHLQPSDASEYLPFIEGFARAGDLVRAEAFSDAAYKRQPSIQPTLCRLWHDLAISVPSLDKTTAFSALGCYNLEGSSHE